MYLCHNTPYNNIKTILKDGYLKSGQKTGNHHLYGNSTSKYIYLTLATKSCFGNMYLNPDLLLETKFILHINWSGEANDDDIIYDGLKLTKPELYNILSTYQKLLKLNVIMPKFMNSEILILNDIDLHKYLLKVQVKPKDIDFIYAGVECLNYKTGKPY